MSTRSATIIYSTDWEGNKVEVARFYRHCDGYPEGHGADLALAIEHADIEGGYGCQTILANLLNMNCRIEFEQAGTQHGDIEYLYTVDASDGTIAVFERGWDLDDWSYDTLLESEPLYRGDAAGYLAKYPCCYDQTVIKEHTDYTVWYRDGAEHFTDLADAERFYREAPNTTAAIQCATARTYFTFSNHYVW